MVSRLIQSRQRQDALLRHSTTQDKRTHSCCWRFALSPSLLCHTAGLPEIVPSSCPEAFQLTLSTDSTHLEGWKKPPRPRPAPGGSSRASGLPWNSRAKGNRQLTWQPEGRDSQEQLGPQGRLGQQPSSKATAPGTPTLPESQWGSSGDGFEPWYAHPEGSPATKEVPHLQGCAASVIVDPITSLPHSPGSQLPPGGAQQPETKQRRWGLGSMGNVLFQQSSLPS